MNATISDLYTYLMEVSNPESLTNVNSLRFTNKFNGPDPGVVYHTDCFYERKRYKGSVFITQNPVETLPYKEWFFKHYVPSKLQHLKDSFKDHLFSRLSGTYHNEKVFNSIPRGILYANFNFSIDSGNCGAILLKDFSINIPDDWVYLAICEAIESVAREFSKPLVLMTDRVGGSIARFISSKPFSERFGEANIGTALKNPNSSNSIFAVSFAVKSMKPAIKLDSIL